MDRTKENLNMGALNILVENSGPAEKPQVDIIAVQGLGSDPYFTWVGKSRNVQDHGEKPSKPFGDKAEGPKAEEDQGIMWLKDLLPAKIRNARIASYSYQTECFKMGNEVKTSLRECGEQLLKQMGMERSGLDEKRRPIIFITHSMGGLVVKQALVLASHSNTSRDIGLSTAGILFLGTPHIGTDSDTMEMWISPLTGGDQILMESLESGLLDLVHVVQDFYVGNRDLTTVYYYEKGDSWYVDGLRNFMCDSPKSVSRLMGRIIYLDCDDHSELNKFTGFDDPNFELVYPWIREIARKAQAYVNRNYGHIENFNERGNMRLRIDEEIGVTMEDTDDDGEEIMLHFAAESGNEAVVRLLLENLVSVGLEDDDGRTALQKATDNGNEAVIQLLIEKGTDVKPRKSLEQMTLCKAAQTNNEAAMRLLIKQGANTEARDEISGWTPLFWAALNGNEAAAKLLVDNKADVRAQDTDGGTALHMAAYKGNEAIVRLLIENGAYVKAQDDEGWTALHQAAEKGHDAVVRVLLKSSLDIDAKGGSGWTALHRAVEGRHKEVVQLLVENGADTEVEDSCGWMALQMAAKSGYDSIARILIENGANSEGMNTGGLYTGSRGTALQLALSNIEGINTGGLYTVSHGTALQLAVENDRESVVRVLVENGANIEVRGADDGETVLHKAAKNGQKAIVQLLLDNGAKIDEKDTKNGRTALHWAILKRHEAVVRLLLERGADINVKQNGGYSALYMAAYRGLKDVVQMLIEYGVDIEAKTEGDRAESALQIAKNTGNEVVAKLLVESGAKC